MRILELEEGWGSAKETFLVPDYERMKFILKNKSNFNNNLRASPWPSGSALDHRSLPPVFEYRCGHIWRLFLLSFSCSTFGGRSAHLVYHVQKRGRKTSIIIIIIIHQRSMTINLIKSRRGDAQNPNLASIVVQVCTDVYRCLQHSLTPQTKLWIMTRQEGVSPSVSWIFITYNV